MHFYVIFAVSVGLMLSVAVQVVIIIANENNSLQMFSSLHVM